MRRAAGVIAVVIGITLLGFTFAKRLFTRADDAQKIADSYRPLMSTEGLAGLRPGFEAVKAAGNELATKAQPSLQDALGMNDEQFAA